jgi:hypothetical protein
LELRRANAVRFRHEVCFSGVDAIHCWKRLG